jgi:diguanylate cyclase (GGDEF)-like protein
MEHLSTIEIIESVVQFTEHRDRDLLAETIVSTLFDLLDARNVSYYKIIQSNGKRGIKELIRVDSTGVVSAEHSSGGELSSFKSFDDAADFRDCYRSKEILSQYLQSGGSRLLHPVMGSYEFTGILEIECEATNEISNRLTKGFLKVYQNYLCLLEESEHDTLTGLFNRSAFDKYLEKMLLGKNRLPQSDVSTERRKNIEQEKFWLAVLDIDHFKRINDRFGHLNGDEVLVSLADIMRKSFRNTDKLFRFGGEEFVILLHKTDFDNAYNVLERFRKSVGSIVFPHAGNVTVSIGFVQISRQDIPSIVVGHADLALYHAKQHGRNHVCSYEKLVEEGQLDLASYSFDADYLCPTDSCQVGFAER